jgi:hypothetical protein
MGGPVDTAGEQAQRVTPGRTDEIVGRAERP